MTTHKEALKLALGALKKAKQHIWLGDEKGIAANIQCTQTITVIEKALAQPEKEHESIWIGRGQLREILNGNTLNAYCSPEQDRFADVQLYTTTPKRRN